MDDQRQKSILRTYSAGFRKALFGNLFAQVFKDIVQTRLVLSLVILISSLIFSSAIPRFDWLLGYTLVYVFLIISLGIFKEESLKKKRIKAIPAVLDIIFTSILIYFTGGPDSPWFLLYIFPIVSVSRYLDYRGSVSLALLTIAAYTVVIARLAYPTESLTFYSWSQNVNFYSLSLRSLLFLGIGLVAGNLTKVRPPSDDNLHRGDSLLSIFKEINEELLKNTDLEKIANLILEKAVKFHEADMGEIRIYNDDDEHLVGIESFHYTSPEYQKDAEDFSDRYYEKVLGSQKRLRVYKMRKGKRSDYIISPLSKIFPSLLENLETTENINGLFYFVPIAWQGRVKAIIALCFIRKISHPRIETLEYFAPLIGLALKNIDLFLERSTQLDTLNARFFEVQKYYQALVENSPDPIIVIDSESRVKVFNKACVNIWGYDWKEVKGTKVTKYYATEDYARVVGELLNIWPHRIQDHETSIKAKNGEIIPISLSASNLYDENNNLIASIGVFKDQRQTIKLQEEKTAAETVARMNKFGHMVGHDIKTDLATALIYLDILTDVNDLPGNKEEIRAYYDDIEQALKGAISKINNTLLMGKLAAPKKVVIGIQELFWRIEKSTRPKAESQNIIFIVPQVIDDHLLEIDTGQFIQIFSSFFHNSADALRKKIYIAPGTFPQIVLTARVGDGDLRIDWEDNGVGILPQNIAQIFDPFFTFGKDSGSGLGLFMVKDIIENHQGQISVDSIEGEKTIFTVTVPLYKKESGLSLTGDDA